MCLQIFIKKRSGFYLTYIPDAKAVTDAPDTLLVLMKQRRRWMNGALFAAWRVIRNFTSMIGIRHRNKHPCYRLMGMLLFMVYMILNQLLQFFIVGSFFVAVKIFFKQYFSQVVFAHSEKLTSFFQDTGNFTFATVFSLLYVLLLIFTAVVSVGTPLDKSIFFFRIIGAIFAILTVTSIIGIFLFLTGSSFHPDEKVFVYDEPGYSFNGHWELTGDWNFSVLTLCGWIMLSVYIFPIVLRPMDALLNLKAYLIGMLVYIVMLPTFANLMSIYSMGNLHDISWGNRPSAAQSSSGTNALSSNQQKQQELKNRFMMFRAHFITFWALCNVAYVIIVEALVDKPKQIMNDGTWGFMEGFAVFIAGLVLFRFVFGLLHILRFKFKVNCRKGREYNVD